MKLYIGFGRKYEFLSANGQGIELDTAMTLAKRIADAKRASNVELSMVIGGGKQHVQR